MNNPLKTRADVQRAVIDLLIPAERYFSPSRARVRLGPNSAHFSSLAAEVESFSRLLWGLVPLVAGGGAYAATSLFLEGMMNGTDPGHPEFWGVPDDFDHRFVDAAALGYALCLAPDLFWHPMPARQRRNLTRWLAVINSKKLHDNNWVVFRVLVNLGLRNVGAEFDASSMRRDLARLGSFARGDGWYSDGAGQPCDYYNSYVMHFYAMVYIRLSSACDELSRLLRDRANQFAHEFLNWFAPDGAALPYGRSLVYRFAHVSFWSGLSLANLAPVSWGVIKGIVLRHLRWWLGRPIFSETGLLTVGYAYANSAVGEQYVSPGSPYWSLKAFACLAVPESHPFWSSTEESLPALSQTTVQKSTNMIVCRHRGHVFALSGGQTSSSRPRHFSEKYARFCYSARYGLSLSASPSGMELLAPENTLLVGEDLDCMHERRAPESVEVHDDHIATVWRPWRSVSVTTWLIPFPPWHVRIHRLISDRRLVSLEGGFAIGRDDATESAVMKRLSERKVGTSFVASSTDNSIVCDLSMERLGFVIRAAPNTNVFFPRTFIPVLAGRHDARETWIGCAVAAWPHDEPLDPRTTAPRLTRSATALTVSTPGRQVACAISSP